MAAIVPVLLSDIIDMSVARITTDAAVSVNRTFNPEGFKSPGVSRWVDRSGGIAIGYPALTQSIRPPTSASRVYKVTAKLVLPTLEQTSPSTSTGIQPAPTKAYDLTCVMEFMLPERSTDTERRKLWSLVASLFCRNINASDGNPASVTSVPLENAVVNFEDVY